MLATVLLSVPNVSEGRDASLVDELGGSFAPARLLDTHSDADHNRTVFTLAAEQGSLASALADGARACAERIDISSHEGLHPYVGALDVAPVVHLSSADRPAALAEALTAAARCR